MADLGASQRRGLSSPAMTRLSQQAAIEPKSSSGESYSGPSTVNVATSNLASSANRVYTTLTITGASTDPYSSRGTAYTAYSVKRDNYTDTPIIKYYLACYDTNGNRHEWVDYAISFERAPTLTGATYVGNTLTILGTF